MLNSTSESVVGQSQAKARQIYLLKGWVTLTRESSGNFGGRNLRMRQNHPGDSTGRAAGLALD
jgi:hypothetical protein